MTSLILAKVPSQTFYCKKFCLYVFFLLQTFTIHRTAGEGRGCFLTPLYHFHPLHRHSDINQVITVGRSPLRIASSWTQTENLWLPSASHQTLNYEKG